MKSQLIAATLGAIATLSSLPSLAEVEVQHAYVRATPPSVSNSAGFMVLYNHAAQPLTLTGAHTPRAKASELHSHVNDNGVMRMRQVEGIELPPHGRVVLQPGGYHLMLLDLTQPLQEGETVAVELTFSDGSHQQVIMPVSRNQPHHQHNADHQHQHNPQHHDAMQGNPHSHAPGGHHQ
ncbi:MAG TPA: copper chaperone PCu(A)C [Motiliproteus sp.]